MKREESGNPETKKFQIPLEVTPENKEMLFAAGYTEEDFTIRFVADRRCRVILIDVNEDVYLEYMDSEWREAKQAKRERGRFVSLSALEEIITEAEDVGFEEDVLNSMLLDDIGARLFEYKSVYGKTFSLARKGLTQREMMAELNMSQQEVSYYVRQVMKKAASFA